MGSGFVFKEVIHEAHVNDARRTANLIKNVSFFGRRLSLNDGHKSSNRVGSGFVFKEVIHEAHVNDARRTANLIKNVSFFGRRLSLNDGHKSVAVSDS